MNDQLTKTVSLCRSDIYNLLRGGGTMPYYPTTIIIINNKVITPVICMYNNEYDWDYVVLGTLTLDELWQLYSRQYKLY